MYKIYVRLPARPTRGSVVVGDLEGRAAKRSSFSIHGDMQARIFGEHLPSACSNVEVPT